MFGYIKTDDPYLYKKDDVLYKSLYCGVCKAIGATCGQMSRFALSFDVAFLSAFAHNVTNTDVKIEKKRCIAHPLKRRPTAGRDALTELLARINTLLAYYKTCDDVFDGGKGRLKRLLLKRGFRRAKKACPEIDGIIATRYAELRELERAGADSVDRVADPFSVMLAEISDAVLGDKASAETHKLFYAVGKWIYLIDALDDYDKDLEKNGYNVFRACYNRASAKKLLACDEEEIGFIFSSLFSDVDENLRAIKFYFNRDLINNILSAGLKKTFAEVVKRISDER